MVPTDCQSSSKRRLALKTDINRFIGNGNGISAGKRHYGQRLAMHHGSNKDEEMNEVLVKQY